MALAQLIIQQTDQPDRRITLRRLPGEKRFGLSVKSAEGGTYRQSVTIKRVSNPEVLRKLWTELSRRPTDFTITAEGKSYGVKSTLVAGTGDIRLNLSDGTLVTLQSDDSDEPVAMGTVAIVIVAVAAVVAAVAVVNALTATSDDGSSNIEAEGGGDDDDSGDNE